MVDRRYLETWARTRDHLHLAFALLPAHPVESDEGGRIARYLEFVEHNELGLALDELEGLGAGNSARHQFWTHLRGAALEMRLDQHVLRLDRRLAENAG